MKLQRNGYKETGKGSATVISLDRFNPSFRDRLLNKASKLREKIDDIEELMLPEWMHPTASAYREYPQEIQNKVDKLFEANKFQKQKQAMQMYFGNGMTINQIAEITGQHKQSVYRSITLGVEKIQKKLTQEEWSKIKWYYRIKSNDSLKSTVQGRFKSEKELQAYKKTVQQASEVKVGRLVNGVVVFE